VLALVSSGNFGAADAEVVSTALELLERRYDARKAASQGSHQPDDGGAHSQGLERELEASARGTVQTAESATPVVGQDEFGTAPIQNVDIAPQTLVEVELAAADDALDAGVVAAEISVPPACCRPCNCLSLANRPGSRQPRAENTASTALATTSAVT
jgi:hypothetical protein